MSAYLILGHGFEDVKEERQIMPKGYTLVTMAECGILTRMPEMGDIMNALTLSPGKATDPDELQKIMKTKLRIYEEGDEYPNLEVSLFTDAYTSDRYKKHLYKSGVYKIPLPFNTIDFNDGPATVNRYGHFDNSTGIIEKAYEGAVLTPPITKAIQSAQGQQHVPVIFLKNRISLTTIFDELGPGVYYYPLCRDIKPAINFNTRDLPEHIIISPNTVEQTKYLLNTHERNFNYNNYLNIKSQINRIEKNIRPRSANQQARRTQQKGARRVRRKTQTRKMRSKTST